jgi:hypothetical protein
MRLALVECERQRAVKSKKKHRSNASEELGVCRSADLTAGFEWGRDLLSNLRGQGESFDFRPAGAKTVFGLL